MTSMRRLRAPPPLSPSLSLIEEKESESERGGEPRGDLTFLSTELGGSYTSAAHVSAGWCFVRPPRPGFIALVAPPMTTVVPHTHNHTHAHPLTSDYVGGGGSTIHTHTHTRAPQRLRRRQRQLCWELNAFAFFIRLLNSEHNGSPPLRQ